MKKKILLALCLFTGIVGINQANASVVWTLNDFTFSDGGTATGTFTWDEVTNQATNWNIFTSPPGTSVLYSDSTGTSFTIPSIDELIFEGTRQLRLGLFDLNDLDTAVANLGLFSQNTGQTGPNGFLQCSNCGDVRFGSPGAYLSSTSVPAPATLGLFALGLILLGGRNNGVRVTDRSKVPQ